MTSLMAVLAALAAPALAHAQLTVSSFGYGSVTFASIMASIVQVLKVTIVFIASAIFVTGAAMYIISAGDDSRKTQGKQMMVGSLIGMGIVLGAQGILDTILYFLYG